MAYAEEPIVNKSGGRDALLTRVYDVCAELEKAMGGPLDVEGCVGDDGVVYIV